MEERGSHVYVQDFGVQLDATVLEKGNETAPMVQAVADSFGDDGLARDVREFLFKPALESQHEWLGLFRAHGTALVGRSAADRLLDRIEHGDALKGFARDRRRTTLCDIKELSSQVCPAKGERDCTAGPCIVANVLVSGVSVALHDAAIGLERLQRARGATA